MVFGSEVPTGGLSINRHGSLRCAARAKGAQTPCIYTQAGRSSFLAGWRRNELFFFYFYWVANVKNDELLGVFLSGWLLHNAATVLCEKTPTLCEILGLLTGKVKYW